MNYMNFTESKKWRCMDCDVVFFSSDNHHQLDYCPVCKINAVDHESYLIRRIGNVKEIIK